MSPYIIQINNYEFIDSFIRKIYIATLQETCSKAPSVQLRPERNDLRYLLKEDNIFREQQALHKWEPMSGVWTDH